MNNKKSKRARKPMKTNYIPIYHNVRDLYSLKPNDLLVYSIILSFNHQEFCFSRGNSYIQHWTGLSCEGVKRVIKRLKTMGLIVNPPFQAGVDHHARRFCTSLPDNSGGYFKVYYWMVEEEQLIGTELLCYALVWSFVHSLRGSCHASCEGLASMCGVTRQTMAKTLKQLIAKDKLKEVPDEKGVKHYLPLREEAPEYQPRISA